MGEIEKCLTRADLTRADLTRAGSTGDLELHSRSLSILPAPSKGKSSLAKLIRRTH